MEEQDAPDAAHAAGKVEGREQARIRLVGVVHEDDQGGWHGVRRYQ